MLIKILPPPRRRHAERFPRSSHLAGDPTRLPHQPYHAWQSRGRRLKRGAGRVDGATQGVTAGRGGPPTRRAAALASDSQARAAVSLRPTHPFPPAPFLLHPAHSTRRPGPPACHSLRSRPAALGLQVRALSGSRGRSAQRRARPRLPGRSPAGTLGRLRARAAAAPLRRAPGAAVPPGPPVLPASPAAGRRPLPAPPPARCGPGVSGFPRSRRPNAPASAAARATPFPTPSWRRRLGTCRLLPEGEAAPGAGVSVVSPPPATCVRWRKWRDVTSRKARPRLWGQRPLFVAGRRVQRARRGGSP